MGIAHLAFDFGLGSQRRDGIDDDDVDRAGAHQHVRDLERLLARVGLGNEEFVDVDAELLGVCRVEGVFCIDKSGRATGLLRLGNDLQRQRRLARGFGSVDLDDAPLGQAADTQRNIQTDRARRNGLDVPGCLAVSHAHDRALTELFFDLA